jgi:aryl-alcohol dehydrogenase-like predicted oxidoreductase
MMRKTFLGRTGLEISELAFGGGVTGGILINPDEATRYTAMRRAVTAGINWIDTAPVYGNGASEETIGRHLEQLTPRPHISTKVRLEADDLDDIPGSIERSLEQSLAAAHRSGRAVPAAQSPGRGGGCAAGLDAGASADARGVADTFDRLKEQGLIRRPASPPRAIPGRLDVISSGRFDAAQVYYNAINPTAAWRRVPAEWSGGQALCGILAACFNENMGVLNIRIWAGGLLATAERPERLFVITKDTDLENEMRCATAVRGALGFDYGSPAQAALRFVLGNRDLTSRVVGITKLEQLEEAIDAVAQGPLPSAAISKLDTLWANDFRTG